MQTSVQGSVALAFVFCVVKIVLNWVDTVGQFKGYQIGL